MTDSAQEMLHEIIRKARAAGADAADALVYDREPHWAGPIVHSLSEFATALVSSGHHRPPGW